MRFAPHAFRLVSLLLLASTQGDAAGIPGPPAVLETRTLCGFESHGEIESFFRAENWREIRIAAEHAEEGTGAQVSAAGGQGLFKAWLPLTNLLDVSGWDTVRFWTYNPGERRIQIGFTLQDADGQAVALRRLYVGPRSGRWIESPVATLRQNGVDPARLRKIVIGVNPSRVPGAPVEGREARAVAARLHIDSLQVAAWRQPLDALRRELATNAAAYAAALQDNPAAWIAQQADRLAQAATPEAAQLLVGGLSHPGGAYLCTDALIRMEPAITRSALVAALTGESANARRLACAVLGAQGDAAAAPDLALRLGDEDPYVRHFAAEALADLPAFGVGVEQALVTALEDPYPLVRLNAAKALARATTNQPAVVSALMRHVDDPAAGVNAIRALAALEAREAVPVLLAALADERLAWDAAEALATVGGPEAAAGVTACLQTWVAAGTLSGRRVEAASRAAGRLGDVEAAAALAVVLARSDDSAARYYAAQALGRLGRVEALADVATDDPSPLVRAAAERALVADQETRLAAVSPSIGSGSLNQLEIGAPDSVVAPAADTGAGFTLFSRRPEWVVTNTARPEAEDARDQLVVRAAGDERLCLQLGVRAHRDLVHVRLLPPEGLPVTPDLYVLDESDGRAVLKAGTEVRWLPAGYSRAFWLTAHIPADTPPGTYTSRLTVDVDGTRSSLPLTLTILPFVLPALTEPMHILYTGELTPGVRAADPLAVRTARVVYGDMAAHGMNAACPTPEFAYLEDASGLPDVSLFTQGMALAERSGLRYPRMFFFVGNALSVNKRKWSAPWVDFRAYYHPKRAQWLAYQLAQTAPGRTALYLVDEPTRRDTSQDGVARNRLAALLYAKVKEVPGAYTAMTGSEEDFAALGDAVDLWVFGRAPQLAQAEDALDRGARVTSYGGLRHARGDEYGARLKFGAYTWRSGEFGQSIWTYPRNMCATVGPDGTTPYPAWECIRLGVDDLRYLRLLETRARDNLAFRPQAIALFRALNAALHPERDDPSWLQVDPVAVRAAVVDALLAEVAP